MRPQEKEALEYLLSADDLAQLLNDVNSFEYKRKIEHDDAVAREKAYFLHLLCTAEWNFIEKLKHTLAHQHEQAVLAKQAYERYEEFEKLYKQDTAAPQLVSLGKDLQVQAAAQLIELNKELESLLTVPPAALRKMTAIQLQQHHHAVLTNLHQQVFTRLIAKQGPTLMVGGRNGMPPQVIVLPKTAPTFHATAAQVLQQSKELATKVAKEPGMKEAFATFHTLYETGPLGVIKSVRHMLDTNKLSDTPADSLSLRRELNNIIEATLVAIKKGHETLSSHLMEANKQGLELFFKTFGQSSGLASAPPALYGKLSHPLVSPTPKPSSGNHLEDEEENTSSHKRTPRS